jgi:hypothetical protein
VGRADIGGVGKSLLSGRGWWFWGEGFCFAEFIGADINWFERECDGGRRAFARGSSCPEYGGEDGFLGWLEFSPVLDGRGDGSANDDGGICPEKGGCRWTERAAEFASAEVRPKCIVSAGSSSLCTGAESCGAEEKGAGG